MDERRGVEFKSAGPFSDIHLCARVTRAVLGMANRRDGGFVVLGVRDQDGVLTPTGLSPEELDTWRYDDVAARVSSYADPPVIFDFETHERVIMHFTNS